MPVKLKTAGQLAQRGPQPLKQKRRPVDYSKAPPVPRTTRRPCLGPLCRGERDFDSYSPGHRICPGCRAVQPRLAPVEMLGRACELAEPVE